MVGASFLIVTMRSPAIVAALARHHPWFFAAVSFGPLLALWPTFSSLFWYADEWDQLDLISRHGFFAWVVEPFGENLAPVTKLAWGSLVLLSGGEYAFMIVAVWVVHALNVGLLGAWMRRAGFSAPTTGMCLAVFGLSSIHFESLGWSIVLIMVLATTFLLAAGLWIESRPEPTALGWREIGIAALFMAASALTSVRGIAVAAAFGGAMLLTAALPERGESLDRFRVLRAAIAFLAVSAVFIADTALRVASQLDGPDEAGTPFAAIAEFALYYWGNSPFHRLLVVDGFGIRTTILLAALKLGLIVLGLRFANGPQRRLLLVLLFFEFASAGLLGLGRHHTGLTSAASSRYQYMALLCTLPFLAPPLDRALGCLRPKWLHQATAIFLVAASAWWAARRWPVELTVWASWRGPEQRRILLEDPSPPPDGTVPGMPWMPTERGRAIAEEFRIE